MIVDTADIREFIQHCLQTGRHLFSIHLHRQHVGRDVDTRQRFHRQMGHDFMPCFFSRLNLRLQRRSVSQKRRSKGITQAADLGSAAMTDSHIVDYNRNHRFGTEIRRFAPDHDFDAVDFGMGIRAYRRVNNVFGQFFFIKAISFFRRQFYGIDMGNRLLPVFGNRCRHVGFDGFDRFFQLKNIVFAKFVKFQRLPNITGVFLRRRRRFFD